MADCGALDGLGGLLDQTVDEDNGFGGDAAGKLDHLPAERVAGGNDGLDGVEALSEDEEGEFGRLVAGILDDGSEANLGGFRVVFGNVNQVDTRHAGGGVFLGADHGQLAIVFLGDIFRLLCLFLGILCGLALGSLFGLEGERLVVRVNWVSEEGD